MIDLIVYDRLYRGIGSDKAFFYIQFFSFFFKHILVNIQTTPLTVIRTILTPSKPPAVSYTVVPSITKKTGFDSNVKY